MEDNTKLKVLKSIGEIYEASKACKLEGGFFTKLDAELLFLSKYFQTTKSQSFFIAMVFALNYKGDAVDLNDLIDYFDCNPMKILEFSDDFNFLSASGIFKKQKSKHRVKVAGTNDQFVINEKITTAILQNKPLPEINQETITDIFGLLEKLYNLGIQRDEEDICTYELFLQSEKLISANLQFPLIKKIDLLSLTIEDAYLYLYLVWKITSGGSSIDIGRALEGIYDNTTTRMQYMQKILTGQNVLIQNDLVEIVEARFFNDTQVKLTDYSYAFLKECGIHLMTTKRKKQNIISPNEIPFRQLFYSEAEMKQLFLLKDILKDNQLGAIQQRLKEKNLPVGMTVLLHGLPGTGKTEIVKQLAKETNRELMKVDISQSKSMWFGESEKVIKRIFTEFKLFSNECEQSPILLFNEADAIFSKRREISNSSVSQTENAIQNIILEELENFEGILMATTNLANNFDNAFERRFLFKIRFKNPDISIRAKIWKTKLPSLKAQDCQVLAEKFKLSGGQIDNIIRKKAIHEIIHGDERSLKELMEFCSDETLISNPTKIGFN
jgi:SpoVK/Ycf46/Vps4 family AAA+-type ATPase